MSGSDCGENDRGEAGLREELRFLERNYLSQPPVIRREDLAEINSIRSQLGMRLVDDQLVEINGVDVHAAKDTPPSPETAREVEADPHQEARAIYQRYLQKLQALEPHRQYADKIVQATDGQGMTPVRPLATMGTNGGPLLCDYCEKPIPLEGGKYHGKAAHIAWRECPNPPDDWASWILGGLVVEIETNHTLRIYHGYPNQRDACCGRASAADDKARREFGHGEWFAKQALLADFVKDEFSELDPDEQRSLVERVLDELFGYDPGIGVNRP